MSLSLLCLVLLFVGGPDSISPRSFQRAWDSGHIVAFFLWTSFFILAIEGKGGSKGGWFVVILLFSSFCLGAGIELLQVVIGRSFSWGDVIRDVGGAFIAISLFLRKPGGDRDVPIIFARILLLAFLVCEFAPLARFAADEVLAAVQYPVLSDFETPFEAERWGKNSSGRSRDVARYGDYSLKVKLLTTQYSGIALKYFPGDWRGFEFLTMGIYKRSPGRLQLHIRVHDDTHTRTGNQFRDRYSETFIVDQGWNDISVATARIRKAPANRDMDMKHIQGLGIFAMNLDREEVIYIDGVALTGGTHRR